MAEATEAVIAREIRLGQRPADVAHVVKFPGFDGAPYMLPITYRYRTLTELGVMDEACATQAAEAMQAAYGADEVGAQLTPSQQAKLTANINGQLLFAIATDWGLDVPFSLAACIQLADEMPLACATAIRDYRTRLIEGRLGN